MKSTRFSEDVLPIGEFKAKAAAVLRKLREHRRPVVLTQNGRPAAVLISPEEFDRLAERERFIAAVEEGLADARAGRVVDDDLLDDESADEASVD
jgi:prevent-host-death family protein